MGWLCYQSSMAAVLGSLLLFCQWKMGAEQGALGTPAGERWFWRGRCLSASGSNPVLRATTHESTWPGKIRWMKGGRLSNERLAALVRLWRWRVCEGGRIPRVSFLLSQCSSNGIIKTNSMPKLKSEHMFMGVVGNTEVTVVSFW